MIIPLRLLNIEKHLFATSCQEICQIAAPLKSFGIQHFAFQRKHKDGSVELLGTHPEFTKKFIENKLYKTIFCGPIENYSNCYAFWEEISCHEIIQLAMQSSNLTNGLVITKPAQYYCDFYYFASFPADLLTKTFYLNNIDLLEKFVTYFNNAARSIFKISNRQRILYPNPNDFTLLSSDKVKKLKETSSNIDKTLENFYYTELIQLTKKEIKICNHIKDGCSAKEIGQLEDLSCRTVEKHIDHIKHKFNCDTILKLVCKLNNIPL